MAQDLAVNELLTLRLPQSLAADDDLFFDFCQVNDLLRLERDSAGNLLIMPPTGSETGRYNLELTIEVGIWNRKTKLGYAFDSSAGFRLPNSAVRSPDVSWVSKERWDHIPAEKREKFAPLCPDFVIEIRSRTDNLKELKGKMEEYRENGCRLGWLIDRAQKRVFIYREDGSIDIRTGASVLLSGETVLSGFEITLAP